MIDWLHIALSVLGSAATVIAVLAAHALRAELRRNDELHAAHKDAGKSLRADLTILTERFNEHGRKLAVAERDIAWTNVLRDRLAERDRELGNILLPTRKKEDDK